jgi:hypothetical protein
MRSIMRAVAAEAPSGGGPESAEWSPETDARRARDEWIDRESDRRTVEAIASGEGVFDAWALPWLYAGADAVRVWIEADLASRVERCLLSYEMRGEAPPADPAGLIEEKDEFSRRQFRRLYGIELGPDPDERALAGQGCRRRRRLQRAAAGADRKRSRR